MIGAERFLADSDRALKKRRRFDVVAHYTVKFRQIVEAQGGQEMFRT